MSYPDLLNANWSGFPGDIIDSIVPYLSAWEVVNLCLYNDTFNRRICQNQDSIVWKLLYQRDISNNVPSDHIASRYLDIMDEILPLNPNKRLIYGADHGYNGIVNSALQHGADIHANHDGALRLAAGNGYTDTVKVLLDRGADIHAYDELALRWAAKYALELPSGRPQAALRPGAKPSQAEPSRAKTHAETVKLLLDRGADIHAEDDQALLNAAENGNTEIVKLLLDRGADIHAVNDAALRYTAMKGRTETVKLLLDRGARIHAFDDDALYWAAYYGYPETVKVLLAYGATITPRIREMAEYSRNPEIIALLK